ncbi:MAG TPA: hypothetical protein PKD96_04470, partial [Candidatus Absconditabacterales bacterium]|nr:hypothetical protein [Candidatus Absconditabacterales bacterium]
MIRKIGPDSPRTFDWSRFISLSSRNIIREFKTIFIGGWFADEYRSPVENGEVVVLPSELRHLEQLPIDEGQKKWYLQQYDLLGRDVFQEYPSTPEEAF